MSSATPMTLTTFDVPPQGPQISGDAGEFLGQIVRGQSAGSAIKRSIDMVGSFFGLVMLLPLLAVIAVLIRLDSKGPILFRQKRVGLGGREFLCLKFRTMVVDAEARLRDLEARNESAGGVLFKIKDDPRITPLGRFLRRTSLDEFPQLWNVLRGDMSLVGPPAAPTSRQREARATPSRALRPAAHGSSGSDRPLASRRPE